MSPQVSKEDWYNDEQVMYLTYREMAVLTMMMKEFASGEADEVAEILKGIEAKFTVQLKPVLYDDDLKKLGME